MAGPVDLPYFDCILARLQEKDAEVAEAFGRFVHWGYWDEPARATGSVADFAQAAERLSQRVSEAAGVRDGQRVLDAGCGFGGTLHDLNQRFSDMDLYGLNIDVRQLDPNQANMFSIRFTTLCGHDTYGDQL